MVSHTLRILFLFLYPPDPDPLPEPIEEARDALSFVGWYYLLFFVLVVVSMFAETLSNWYPR